MIESCLLELSNLIKTKENERFGAIIKLKPELALIRNWYGSSLLHRASEYSNLLCIDVLLKNGCSINHENRNGWKPIHLASAVGCVSTAIMLLLIDETLVNSVNTKNKCTPLHCAAERNQEEFVQYILTQPRIQVNLKDDNNEMADERTTNVRIQQMIREHRSKHT